MGLAKKSLSIHQEAFANLHDIHALCRRQEGSLVLGFRAAAGQVFFSLSVGFGVIINYASYMRKKTDVVLSGLTAAATNEVFEVSFGGLITITASFVFLGLNGTIAAVAGEGAVFGVPSGCSPVGRGHFSSVKKPLRDLMVIVLPPGDVEASVERMVSSKNATIRNRQATSVSGFPATMLDYEYRERGQSLRVHAYSVNIDDTPYFISATAPSKEFPRYLPEFQRFFDSFRAP